MPSAWSLEVERKLLLAIIEVTEPKKLPWNLVAERMGGSFSIEACRQHFSKVRRIGGAGNPTTPRKGSKETNSSSKKRKPGYEEGEPEDDDEGLPLETPSKRPRREKKINEHFPPIKKEVKEEDAKLRRAFFKQEDGEGHEFVDLVTDDELYD